MGSLKWATNSVILPAAIIVVGEQDKERKIQTRKIERIINSETIFQISANVEILAQLVCSTYTIYQSIYTIGFYSYFNFAPTIF